MTHDWADLAVTMSLVVDTGLGAGEAVEAVSEPPILTWLVGVGVGGNGHVGAPGPGMDL